MTRIRQFLFILALFPYISTLAFSKINSAVPQNSAELPILEEFHPRQGTYLYDVFWQGIHIGDATLSLTLLGDTYKIRVHAKTVKNIDFFYRLRYNGEVEIEPTTLIPRTATIKETSGSKKKEISFSFPEKDRAEGITIEKKRGKKKEIKKTEAISDTFILDPFSIVFLIRNLDWHVGMAGIFDVFTGEKQYKLSLQCKKRISLNMAGEKKEAFVIHPVATNPLKKKKKVNTSFRIYLSTDARREILKIEGVPRVGRVEAHMRTFSSKAAM